MQINLETLEKDVSELLDKIQVDMYTAAKQKFMDKLKKATEWEEFMTHLNNRNVVIVPWCSDEECEEKVKERSALETKQGLFEAENTLTGSAKTLCMPLEYDPITDEKCFHCGKHATVRVIWGRSY